MIPKKIYIGPNQENLNRILKRMMIYKKVRIHKKRVAVTATLFLISVNHLDDVHLVLFRSANRD